jgi:hypothetical protein
MAKTPSQRRRMRRVPPPANPTSDVPPASRSTLYANPTLQQSEHPGWMGQPLGMPPTLRELAGASPGNIVNVPSQNAAEQMTPMPVVHSGGTVALEGRITTGVGKQVASSAFDTATFDNSAFDGPPNTNTLSEPIPVSPPYVEPSQPRDDFAEAAAEAASNPDPVVEREIFEYGVKKDEPPAAGQPVTFVNDKGKAVTFVNDEGEPVTWTADAQSRAEAALRGQGTVAVDAQVAEPRPRRMRTAAGRSVQANNVTIILSVASLVLLIDEKLASLRDGRRNDQDALAQEIAHYEGVKHDLEALRDVAIEVGHGRGDEKAVTKATSTVSECIRKWWNKRHDEICTKGYDAALFISCLVSVRSLGAVARPLSQYQAH